MSALPPPATSRRPSQDSPPRITGGRAAVLALTGMGSLAVWVWAVVKCFSESSQVDDLADSRFLDPSAIQISQVADQALLHSVAYLSVAGASTAAFIVVSVIALGSLWR